MELLKVSDVARQLKLGRSSVYQLAQRGELPVVHIGAAVRIPAQALDEWLARRIEKPVGAADAQGSTAGR